MWWVGGNTLTCCKVRWMEPARKDTDGEQTNMINIDLQRVQKMRQSGLGSMQGSSPTKNRLQPKVLFLRRPSSTKGRLPPKVVFHRRSSSTKGRLPPKASSNRGRLPLKVVFHRRLSSTKGCFPTKVIFHQRSSSTYHNTLVHLIFVRVVNILPCLEVF